LANAIKASSKLNQSLPIKERLNAYKTVFKNIDEILAQHHGSDESIKLLSRQKIGNFDVQLLRQAYINDLSAYYNTVCIVSPSYECLAFVNNSY